MDGQRHIDAVNDPLFDREIESLLAAEPSPEFLARVRARVAEEPSPVRWRASWMLVAAGVTAMSIVALIVWPAREAIPVSAPIEPPRIAEADRPTPPPSSAPVQVRRPRTVTVTTERLVPIVAEEDARAFEGLLATLRDRRVRLVFDDESTAAALSVSALAIPPITIEPLPITLEGGVE